MLSTDIATRDQLSTLFQCLRVQYRIKSVHTLPSPCHLKFAVRTSSRHLKGRQQG